MCLHRLTVWKEIPEKHSRRFLELDTLMQAKHNFRNYREQLAERMSALQFNDIHLPSSSASQASSPSPSPSSISAPSSFSILSSSSLSSSSSSSGKKVNKVVPYFVIFLRDITFATVGNARYLPPRSEPKADGSNDEMGGESPIEGGEINMGWVQMVGEQVQSFLAIRRELRGYEFSERKREEKKEHLRRVVHDFQAHLPAITNAGSPTHSTFIS